jgi:hypothetical protein
LRYAALAGAQLTGLFSMLPAFCMDIFNARDIRGRVASSGVAEVAQRN